MKKKTIVTTFAFITSVIIIAGTAFDSTSSVNGPPAGRSGGPNESGATCNSAGCHTGTQVQTVSNWITSNIPAGGYTPGQTYTITATATLAGISKFGFQASAQSSSGEQKGTLVITNTTQTQIVTGSNSVKYIEHKSAGTSGSGGTKSWTFDWIAPAAGGGTVTFYAAFNCANGNGSSSGDQIFKTTYTVEECVATAAITNSTGDNIVCGNEMLTLNASGGGSEYLWSNGETTSSILAGAGTYTVTVTYAAGCVAVSSPFTVTGFSAPAVSFSPTLATCGQANGAIAVNVIGTGPFAYEWSNGATTQDVTNLLPGTYTLMVTGAGNCLTMGASEVLTTLMPSSEFTVTSTTAEACTGIPVLAEVDAVQPSLTYNWLNVQTGTPTANGYSLTYNTPGTYTVGLWVGNGGCNSDTTFHFIQVNQSPVIALTQTDTFICPGDCVTFTGSANGLPLDSFNYEWIPFMGTISGSTYTVCPDDSTMYTLMAMDGNGCFANYNALVGVNPMPDVDFNVVNNHIFLGDTSSFVSASWLFNGLPISNTQFNIIPTAEGLYTATIVNANRCVNADSIDFIFSRINNVIEHALKTFPNPATDYITIQLPHSASQLSVIDATGRALQKVILHQAVYFQLDISEFSSGLYRLVVSTTDGNRYQTNVAKQ